MNETAKRSRPGKRCRVLGKRMVQRRDDERAAGKEIEQDHQGLVGDSFRGKDGKRHDKHQEQDRKEERACHLLSRVEPVIGRGEEQDRGDKTHVDEAREGNGTDPEKDRGIPGDVGDAPDGKRPGRPEQGRPAFVPQGEIAEHGGPGKRGEDLEVIADRDELL